MVGEADGTLLPSACGSEGIPDNGAWMLQPHVFTERVRAKALVWLKGEEWFSNDPLPRGAHSHPHASEMYYVAKGRLDLTVGRTRLSLRAGDVCFIPEGGFHDLHGTAGTDLCLWAAVAPNWRGARVKHTLFARAEYEVEPDVATVGGSGELPGDEVLMPACVVMGLGEADVGTRGVPAERLVYVLEGAVVVEVGRLHGRLRKHEFIHVPSGSPYKLTAESAHTRFLSVSAVDPIGGGIAAELGVPRDETF